MICGTCAPTPGWVWVDERYVSRHLATQPRLGEPTPPVIPGKRQALENSVAPCPDCERDTYDRWAAGDFASSLTRVKP